MTADTRHQVPLWELEDNARRAVNRNRGAGRKVARAMLKIIRHQRKRTDEG